MYNSDIHSEGEAYRQIWRYLLNAWLGWSTERIESWIEVFEEELSESKASLLFNETPFWYIVLLLIPVALEERLRGSNDDRLVELERRLLDAVHRYGDHQAEKNYDWEAARRRVEAVLAEVGEGLPKPSEVTGYEQRTRQ